MTVPNTTTFKLTDVLTELAGDGFSENTAYSSVTNSGGTARFNTSNTGSMAIGHTLYISGAVYEGLYTISNISINSWFECSGVGYISNSSGFWYSGTGRLIKCFNDAIGPGFDASYRGNMDRQYNFRNYNHGVSPYTYIDASINSGGVTKHTGDGSGNIANDWAAIRGAATGDAVGTYPGSFPYRYIVYTYGGGGLITPVYQFHITRVFIEFDLSAIPSSASLKSARLSLYDGLTSHANPMTGDWLTYAHLRVCGSTYGASLTTEDYDAFNFSDRIFTGAFIQSGSPNGSYVYTFDTDNDSFEMAYIESFFGSATKLQIVIMTACDHADQEMGQFIPYSAAWDYYWAFGNGYGGTTFPQLRIEWGAPQR